MTKRAGFCNAQRRQWERDGSMVLEGVIPNRTVRQLVSEIWSFLEMEPTDPRSWYDAAVRQRSGIDVRGMIPVYHSQAMWAVRQNRKIHAVFAELLGTDDLAVSFDRLNMNPPATDGWDYDGFLHWDIDVTQKPVPFQLQGLVALTDSPAGAGGFQCVQGFQHELAGWLDDAGRSFSGRFPNTAGMRITAVPLRAGDMVIWRGELPHGNTRNTGDAPRLAQYVTFQPTSTLTAADIGARRDSFLRGAPTRSSTMGKAFPKAEKVALARRSLLSDHGHRLLGFNL